MKIVVFDVETIPSQTLPDNLRPQFDPDSVKLGNIKDETKKAERIDEASKQFEAELDKKMSLDPDLCEIVEIGFYNSELDECVPVNSVDDVWELIYQAYIDHVPLVSFNGINFDLPVLWHNAMKVNIGVSPQMYADLTKKYTNHYHYDLMQILAGWDRTKWKSLDFYLKLFNIGEKIGEGSQVYDLWKAGEHIKIKDYCEHDVLMTAKLFKRLEPWIAWEV